LRLCRRFVARFALPHSHAAMCAHPHPWWQIANIEERIAKYNKRYDRLVAQLARCKHIFVPPLSSRVRPVCDSLQFNLVEMDERLVSAFLRHSKRRGLPVGLFGSKDNARNFRNWKYAPTSVELPFTEQLISVAIDVRLPATFDDEDFDLMGEVLMAAVDDALAENADEGI